MNKRPIIILGAGGHAKVLIDTLQNQAANLLGITDPGPNKFGQVIFGVPVIGNDDSIFKYNNKSIYLVNGIGMIDNSDRRRQIFKYFNRCGYNFASVVHDSAVISPNTEFFEGVQIMAGAIIQAGSTIGINSIINSRANIDHDTIIGAHVHIAPGVTISGGVRIDDGTLIGAGATIKQEIKIGSNCIVAAGAVVIRDVPAGTTVMGVPARVVERKLN